MHKPISNARLCAFNLGIQLVWGAVLAVELQTRVSTLVADPARAISAYAWIAGLGAAIAMMVQLMVGDISDRIRLRGGTRQAFYAIGVFGSIPAIAWLMLGPDVASVAAAFAVLEVTMNVAGGPYQAIIPDYVESDRRGIASSWTSVYQSVGNTIGLLVAALVADLRVVSATLALPLFVSYAISAGYARTLTMRTPEADASSIATRSLAALLFSRGLVNVGFFTLLGFLAFYIRDSLLAPAARMQTGLVFTTFTVAAIFGAIGAARATDRFDKRAVITISTVVIALALAILTFATSLPLAYAGATIAGIAWGGFATADWALATATLPQETMATAMGIWNVATTLPQVLAPLATAPLVIAISNRHPGQGPRAALALALVEFLIGGAAIWLVPREGSTGLRSSVQKSQDVLGNDGAGVGMA